MISSRSANSPYLFSQGKIATGTDKTLLQLPAAFVLGFMCVYLKSFASMTPLVNLPDTMGGGLLLVGAAFLSLHILSNAKSYGVRLIPFLLILLSTVYTYLASGETAPFFVSLIIIAGATAGDSKSLIRLWFSVTVFFSLFLIAVYALTALFDSDNLSYIFRNGSDPESVRFTFFFSHPNMAAATVMMICGAYMYLNYDRLDFRVYLVMLGVAFLVLLLTDSKTSTALTVLLVVCFAAQKRWNVFVKRGVRRTIATLPLVLFGLVFLAAGPLYSSSLGALLTGRVSLWHYCLANQGVTLFGQRFVATQVVDSNGWTYWYTTLDCAYASGLFVLGLCFSAFFCWCVYSRVRNGGPHLSIELPLILAMLMFGVTEVHVFSPVICAPLLLLSGGILPLRDLEEDSLAENEQIGEV